MRALLPEPADNVDVHDWYAADWLDGGGVRVNFVVSADGAISVDDRSAGLQTDGDNRIFAALRDLADVIVAGSGTVVAEGYNPSNPSTTRRSVRARFGLAEVAPIAVVSRSLRLDPASPLFTAAAARTVVLTCARADTATRDALEAVAEVVVCGEDEVDPGLARLALEQRGHSRILCEGGPTVFGQWARAGVVDELCLSVAPLLAGPGSGRITAGPTWGGVPVSLELAGLLEEDGALFARYRVQTS